MTAHSVDLRRGHTDAVTCLAVHWESNVAISAGLDQTLLFLGSGAEETKMIQNKWFQVPIEE